MKVEVVVNVKKAYCNADDARESFYQLNYCDVEKLDDERVKLVFDEEQLERVYDEFDSSLEGFIKHVLSRATEATEQYIYNLDNDEFIEDINVEFSDDDIKKLFDAESNIILQVITSDYYDLDDNEIVFEMRHNVATTDVYFADEIMHALEAKLSECYDVERIEKPDSADAVLVRL
ncbi:MAG: hypothetical protein J7K48_03895 [Thermococcus sp.]|nr:hypothetical protein [Thermococcus sp.]